MRVHPPRFITRGLIITGGFARRFSSIKVAIITNGLIITGGLARRFS
jgi:hypothetical protein